jgi:hypothetical protein
MHFLLKHVEAHAALTQAIAAVGSVVIAAAALIYAVWTLKALQRQNRGLHSHDDRDIPPDH